MSDSFSIDSNECVADNYWGDVEQPAHTEGEYILLKATHLLCQKFHSEMLHYSSETSGDTWAKKCCELTDHLREGYQKALNPEGSQTMYMSVVRQLASEENAYHLMYIVNEIAALAEEQESHLGRLVATNDDFRMLLTLLVWTERIGPNALEGFTKNALDQKEGYTHLWDDTSRMLLRGQATEANMELLIGPDGHPAANDQMNAGHFYKMIFSMLRCNMIDDARRECETAGDFLLTTLFPFRLMIRNPNFTPVENSGEHFFWLEKRKSFKEYVARTWEQMESAGWPSSKPLIYALLAGRLRPLIDIASTTEDRIWCYANAAVEHLLDVHCDQDLGVNEGIPVTVNELAEQIDLKLKHESSPYLHVYFYLLKNEVSECVKYMAEWLDSTDKRAGDHIIRFMANLVIIWRRENVDHDVERGIHVITHYINRLCTLRLYTLLPFYYSFYTDRTLMFSKLTEAMKMVQTEELRREFLEHAKLSGIDVAELTHLFVNQHFQSIRGSGEKLSNDDCVSAISTWKWLLCSGYETLGEALIETNTLLRILLKNDEEDLARDVLMHSQTAGGSLADRVKGSSKLQGEYLERAVEEHKSFLSYMAGVEKWLALSSENEELMGMEGEKDRTTSIGLTSMTRRELEERRYTSHVEQTRSRMDSLRKEAEAVFVSFLTHSGWRDGKKMIPTNPLLVDQESLRDSELSSLRSTYYGSVFFLLLSACEIRKDSEGALELAKLLADKQYAFYEDIDREQLGGLLKSLQMVAADSLCAPTH